MSKVYKAIAYSAFSKYINHAINLASIVLIARLLTPDELGVFAIASAISLIAAELKSFGVGGYLIREETLDADKVKRALGLSVLISWTTGTVLVLSSWSIEGFYNKEDIAFLVQVLSIGFFLSPHVGIAKSLMAREFHFKQRFIIETTSQFAQFASAIAFIMLGYSYFSLAYSNAVGFIVEFLAVIFFRPKHFGLGMTFSGIRSIAKFGIFVTFSNLFRKISISVPDLIIGKLGTNSEVAYFSRGLGFLSFLTMFINSGIQPVVAPYLADKKRMGQSLAEPYLNASKLLGGILIPVLAVAGYASGPVIELFFGSQWEQSADLVSILSYWAIFRFIHVLSPSLLVTTGHEKVMFQKDLVMLVITAIVVYFQYQKGLAGVAWGMVFVSFIDFLVVSAVLHRLLDIKVTDQLTRYAGNFIVAAVCVGWAYVLDLLMDFETTAVIITVSVLGVTTGVVWLTSLILIKHPLASEIQEMLGRILGMLRKK
ncbi:hypothetical protein BTA51_10420 [Hahella sp. CCB-MM4]|uniref:oligosaccharide flippase family protein n=1 Tax=Hahella sp. (strain CCB-MM4) TaxID=1926491 RepID=UPI000B9B08F9|nr:oligosaccharide flippase family protein [Hahella sp. CCB-MM4]OZG73431.1 hypothetical protein BTA51_10420 [Hahella sp. CCB-MM4]